MQEGLVSNYSQRSRKEPFVSVSTQATSQTRHFNSALFIQFQNVASEKPLDRLGGSSQTEEDWEHCARILAQHSEEMVQRWKSEIDMLLVFVSVPRRSIGEVQSDILPGRSVFCRLNSFQRSVLPTTPTRRARRSTRCSWRHLFSVERLHIFPAFH